MKAYIQRTVWVCFFMFLLAPIIIVICSSVTSTGLFTWPLDTLTLRWYGDFFSDQRWLDALFTSTVIGLVAAIASTLCAISATLVMARHQFFGRNLLQAAMMLPLIFPHAATGLAFLGLLNSTGLLGTYAGIALAHVIITLPFAFRPTFDSMRQLDPSMFEAATLLGASPLQIFTKVTLPLIKPGVATSLLFCFLISFDETTITLFLVGTKINTLPVKILTDIQESASPVVSAVSTLLIIASVVFVWALHLLRKKSQSLQVTGNG